MCERYELTFQFSLKKGWYYRYLHLVDKEEMNLTFPKRNPTSVDKLFKKFMLSGRGYINSKQQGTNNLFAVLFSF